MRERLKGLFDWRILPALLSAALLFNKILPLCQLSFYNHSNADDYWMSVSIHKVWEDTHSLWAAIGEAFYSAMLLWKDWDGCFLSMFLSGLAPVVFHENYYRYTFFIIGGALFLSVIFFFHVVCRKILHFSWMHEMMITSMTLTMLFCFSPSVKEGMYWWCGGINYTFFFAVFLVSQAFLLEYLVSGHKVFLVLGCVSAFCTGLGNLLSALVNPIVLVLEEMVLLWLVHTKQWDDSGKRKLFWIPVCCGILGLLLNVLAPGNLIRGGSELFHGSIVKTIVETVIASTTLLGDFYRKPAIWFILALFFVILDAFFVSRQQVNFRFPCPLAVGIISYLVYCAAFTPVIYSHNAYYGRCKEISFFVLVILLLCNLMYFSGWVYVRVREKFNSRRSLVLVCVFMLLVLIFAKVDSIYFDTAYAREALVSGSAQNYHDRINERMAQYYNPEIKEVYVKKIDWFPGLFYFDDDCLTDVAYYFNKECIVYEAD